MTPSPEIKAGSIGAGHMFREYVMSITSVGASFGYVNPVSVAGPGAGATQSSDANDAPSPASQSTKTSDGDQASQPGPSASGSPKFAPDTGAALVRVQEKASS